MVWFRKPTRFILPWRFTHCCRLLSIEVKMLKPFYLIFIYYFVCFQVRPLYSGIAFGLKGSLEPGSHHHFLPRSRASLYAMLCYVMRMIYDGLYSFPMGKTTTTPKKLKNGTPIVGKKFSAGPFIYATILSERFQTAFPKLMEHFTWSDSQSAFWWKSWKEFYFKIKSPSTAGILRHFFYWLLYDRDWRCSQTRCRKNEIWSMQKKKSCARDSFRLRIWVVHSPSFPPMMTSFWLQPPQRGPLLPTDHP